MHTRQTRCPRHACRPCVKRAPRPHRRRPFPAQASTLGLLTAEAEALAPPPVQAAALRQMGLELAQRGRAADAAPLLRRALALAPEDEAAAAALAMLRARFGSVGDLT